MKKYNEYINESKSLTSIKNITPIQQVVGSGITIDGKYFVNNETVITFYNNGNLYSGSTIFVNQNQIKTIIPNMLTGRTEVFVQTTQFGKSKGFIINVLSSLPPQPTTPTTTPATPDNELINFRISMYSKIKNFLKKFNSSI